VTARVFRKNVKTGQFKVTTWWPLERIHTYTWEAKSKPTRNVEMCGV